VSLFSSRLRPRPAARLPRGRLFLLVLLAGLILAWSNGALGRTPAAAGASSDGIRGFLNPANFAPDETKSFTLSR
jgi:hypothetical protein